MNRPNFQKTNYHLRIRKENDGRWAPFFFVVPKKMINAKEIVLSWGYSSQVLPKHFVPFHVTAIT